MSSTRCCARSWAAADAFDPELDDPEFRLELEELKEEFRSGLPRQLDDIRAALRRSDWETLRSLIHIVKGTAGSYGYPRLTDLAANVESELASGRYARAAVLCEGLMLEATNALQAWVPT